MKNKLKTILLRFRNKEIKINAALSAICNKCGLIPVKLTSKLNQIQKTIPSEKTRFFVKLMVTNSDFEVEVLDCPDSDFIRTIKKDTAQQQQRKIRAYAEKTISKSYCCSIEGRYNELMGIKKSFK